MGVGVGGGGLASAMATKTAKRERREILVSMASEKDRIAVYPFNIYIALIMSAGPIIEPQI